MEEANNTQTIKTSDLIKAYLRTEQDRYRVVPNQEPFAPAESINIFVGKIFVATIIFNDNDPSIICKLMEGRRRIELHHPRSLELLIETLKCFEFLMGRVINGEVDAMDIIDICKDDEAWPKAKDCDGTGTGHNN
jgi:hypothetical protein